MALEKSLRSANRPCHARARVARDGGFSILEVLIASTIMIAGAASLAQLFFASTRTNQAAKNTSLSAMLAQQKMEQLRSLAWGFDLLGLPSTDTTTDTTTVPENPAGGTGLQPSPPGTLNTNTIGYVDYIDRFGAGLGGNSTVPLPNTAYIRRWSIVPLPTNPNNTLVLQVYVRPITSRSENDASITAGSRGPQEARMMSVKTRKAS